MNSKRGKVLGEQFIEDIMARNGYEIYHPQKHTARAQLEKYASASHIVCVDGSALHMAAYAVNSDYRIAMIARRQSTILPRIIAQIKIFSGAEALMLDALKGCWEAKGSNRINYSSIGDLDFDRLIDLLEKPVSSPRKLINPMIGSGRFLPQKKRIWRRRWIMSLL